MTPSTDPTTPALVLVGIIGITRSRLVIAPREPGAEPLVDLEGQGALPGTRMEQKLDLLARTARHARDQAAERLGTEPRIVAATLAVHGLARTEHEEATVVARTLLRDWGIPRERIQVDDDLLTSFLAGGVGADGILLRAGTGAVGVRYEGRAPKERRDGMGWLLGDIGSAVWIGRRTLQVVAADLDGRGPRTLLTERVGDALGLDLRDGLLPPSPTGDVRDDLSRAVFALAPPGRHAELGRFAPLPGSVPEDPAARRILDQVMRCFADTVRTLDPHAELPVVLAGSVLATPGPIHDELVTGFDAEGREHRETRSGIEGALLLAREAAAEE